MEEITALQIIKFSENLWGFTDSTMPVGAEPNLADVYAGVAEGDYISFTTRNGSNIYNRIPASIITYVDEVNPANNFGPVSALELIQYLKTDGFFGSGSGGEGETPTLQGLANSLIPNLVGRNGQYVVISGSGFTTQTLPSGFIQNNIAKVYNYNLTGAGEVTTQEVANKMNNLGSGGGTVGGFSISEIETPVIINVNRNGKQYKFLFKKGKGNYGNPTLFWPNVEAIDYELISILQLTPDDIEADPNAVITNLDPVTDGDYITKANLTQWDFTDSGNTQPDGGVKTYYFTYTQDGVLYFVQFIGEQGEYGGGISPDLTEEMFAAITNSDETPDGNYVEKTGQLSQTIEGDINLSTGNLTIQNVSIKSTGTPPLAGISGADLYIGQSPNLERTSRFYINEPMVLTNNGGHAFADYTPITQTENGGAYASFDSRPEVSGAFDWVHLIAYQARLQYTGSGNITDNMVAVSAALVHNGTGNVNEGIAVNIPSFSGTGTYTSRYGIKIGNFPIGANDYAIYTGIGKVRIGGSFSVASTSVFTGNAGFGTNAIAKVHSYSNTSAYAGAFGGVGNGVVIMTSANDPTMFVLNVGRAINPEALSGVTPIFQIKTDGTSTFTNPVTVATPTADLHAATKKYVDDSISSVKDGNINVTTSSGGTTTPVLSTFYGKNGNATVFVNATAGVGEVVLESAALMAGKTVIVIKTDASVNAVTIKGAGTTNINGSNTYVISTQYDNVSIKSNGTQYYIVS